MSALSIGPSNLLSLFKGITEENLDKLLSHALIPTDKKNVISNLQHLNLQIIQDQSRVSERASLWGLGRFSITPSAWEWCLTRSRQSNCSACGIGIIHKIFGGDFYLFLLWTSMTSYLFERTILVWFLSFFLSLSLYWFVYLCVKKSAWQVGGTMRAVHDYDSYCNGISVARGSENNRCRSNHSRLADAKTFHNPEKNGRNPSTPTRDGRLMSKISWRWENFSIIHSILHLSSSRQDIIDDKLDLRQFPSVGGQRNAASAYAVQRWDKISLRRKRPVVLTRELPSFESPSDANVTLLLVLESSAVGHRIVKALCVLVHVCSFSFWAVSLTMNFVVPMKWHKAIWRNGKSWSVG